MPAIGIYRVRIVLHFTKTARLHAQHGAAIYALLSAAYGRACNTEPVMPDGVLPECPEQCRTELAKESEYAFGLTLFAVSAAEAAERLDQILDGLRTLGRHAAKGQPALGGNFRVGAVQDLIAGHPRADHRRLVSLPHDVITDQVARVLNAPQVTLQFLSPLRFHRSKHDRSDGHAFFDRDCFRPRSFVSRLENRLESLDVPLSPQAGGQAGEIPLLANHLVWLDVSYGPKQHRKALGGAMGRVVLGAVDERTAAALVWGQYVRIGESTRFGFGQYRPEELGPCPYACQRTAGLLELAFTGPRLDRVAEELDLPSGSLRQAARDLCAGQYQPQPHFRVDIVSGSGKQRTLAIPSRRDRALQRVVLDQIAPALDKFWEDSSFAYRKGLGRQRAARRIQDAYRLGYRWAVRADFASFFDSVPLDELSRRISAYLSDPTMEAAVMTWVRAGAPEPGRGLPTGAPLSPLLANLLLDCFDEQMQAQGGMLVRYADDFLVLFHERSQADAVFHAAEEAAAALQLELNRDKTGLVDLDQGFEFLGFRFERRQRWEISPGMTPQPLDDLGWKERSRPVAEPQIPRLAGESEYSAAAQATVVWGPGVERLHCQGNQLICTFADERPPGRVPLERVRELVVLGDPALDQTALRAIKAHAIHLFLADDGARELGTFHPQTPLEDAESVIAQAALAGDPGRRLQLARQLIGAKLHNYAELADAHLGRFRDYKTGRVLRRLAARAAACESLERLLGLEGAGAARWYGHLEERLGGGFVFRQRVAPNAGDPVNAMLNLAQTVLHRHLIVMLRQCGLAPSIGVLHCPHHGHAALASDMQEPFRHLMDRAVIEASAKLRPTDFQEVQDGKYTLLMRPRAVRELLALIHQILAIGCNGAGQGEPRAYRLQMLSQIRSLRRHLNDPEDHPFKEFRHP